jgi:hypothetical protein
MNPEYMDAYATGYLQGRLGEKSNGFPEISVPKHGKEMEWLLFQILNDLKALNVQLAGKRH